MKLGVKEAVCADTALATSEFCALEPFMVESFGLLEAELNVLES